MTDTTTQSLQLEPAIDFDFISALEGNNITEACISEPTDNSAGVKIALGLDLAITNDSRLRQLGLNPTLIGKLYPYLGRCGEDAKAYLDANPLSLSIAETSAINMGLKYKSILRLIMHYDNDSNLSFCELPACWQTVIASVSFQCECLADTYPVFWRNVIMQNWQAALHNLDKMESEHAQRRQKEVEYIKDNSTL